MPNSTIDLDLRPDVQEDGALVYTVGERTVRMTPRGAGWIYEGAAGREPVHVVGIDDPPLRFGARLQRDEAVARFACPLHVPAGVRVEIWLAWPLEIVVSASGAEIDRVAAFRRRTLFGKVSDGRVIPTSVCAPTIGAADDTLDGLTRASLRVRVHNRGSEPARLTRVPVIGDHLALHRRGDHLAATGVKVDLLDGGRAEALTEPGRCPEGFDTVAPPIAHASQVSPLGWLVDATRRSVEFPL